MVEFFKQFINHVLQVWNKLSLSQKILVSTIISITFIGLAFIIFTPVSTSKSEEMVYLYKNLSDDDMAAIIDRLKQDGYKYKIGDDGRSILVPKNKKYEIKMVLAKDGLPADSKIIGYELLDKSSLGLTDFQLKVNYKRALEGELAKTISSIKEIEACRVHIVFKKESIFEDKEEPAKVSVIVKLKPGKRLTKKQIEGIVYLVSSAVEGLDRNNVTIVDQYGNLLTSPYQQEEIAHLTAFQQELKNNVEKALQNKIQSLLDNILGPGKSVVRVSADLNFERIEKTVEQYNPEGGVVRSKEVKKYSSQSAQDQNNTQKEDQIVNYEIDKTISHIIGEVGNIKRLTVSVAIDGIYKKQGDSIVYVPRSEDELAKIEELVKKAVGFNADRGDEVVVTNVQFDRSYINQELMAMEKEKKKELLMKQIKWGLLFFVVIFIILLLKSMVSSLMNVFTAKKPEYIPVSGPSAAVAKEEEEEEEFFESMVADIEDQMEENIDVIVSAIRVLMQSKSKGGDKK